MSLRGIGSIVAIGLAFAIASAQDARAQQLGADEIVARSIEAMGGVGRIESWETLRIRYDLPDHEGISMSEVRRPNLFRAGRLVFDGERAAILPPSGGVEQGDSGVEMIPAEEWKDFELDIAWSVPAFLDHPAELLGTDSVVGHETYMLGVSLPLGAHLTYYVDAATFVVLKAASDFTIRGNDYHWERLYTNHREVDGILFPWAFTYPGRRGEVLTARLVEVEINPELPAEHFRIPGAAWRGPYFDQAPPGDTPVLFAPEILDFDGGYHSTIVFSPDGRAAYWTRMSMDSWTTTMEEDGWTPPHRVTFGMAEDVTQVTLAPGGDRAFFLSSEPTPSDPEERERVWWADRRGDTWGQPRPMQDEIISHPTHWDFSVARNNNLYFTSRADGVRGRGDIYVARFDGERYAEPEDLGPEINSDGNELCPFISPDESFLVFSRDGPETRGLDLFVSFRKEDGTWSEAVSLGETVNSERNEISPAVSPDGCYLFFTSSRTRRMLVYWVDSSVIHRLRADGDR